MADPGEGPGGPAPPPLVLGQTEAQRAEKIFLETPSTPPPPPPPPRPPLSKGLDDRASTYLKVWIRH